MNRALIFDFGGVIMKTVDYIPRLSWDERLGLAPGTVEKTVHNQAKWKVAQRGELPIEAYWQDVAQQLRLTPDQLQQLQADFYAGDQLDQEVISFIETKKNEGFTVALLSNDSVELRPKLERLKIHKLFNPLVISAEIGVMKPDSGAYEAVLEALQRPADETIFIDDMQVNVNAASALGIYGVHYQAGMNLDEVLQPLLKV